jgi:hypothetical protein
VTAQKQHSSLLRLGSQPAGRLIIKNAFSSFPRTLLNVGKTHSLDTLGEKSFALSHSQDTRVKINKMQLSSGREKSAAAFYYPLLDEVPITKSHFWLRNLLLLLQLFPYFLVRIFVGQDTPKFLLLLFRIYKKNLREKFPKFP